MSATYTVGIIGCGRPWRTEGATGFGMSHAHAKGFNAAGNCKIVALCDTVERNAQLFNEEHAGGEATLYDDYEKLLADARPDIVAIGTWPHLHAPMVLAAAQAGVKAIHCEKPMAGTFGEARAMADACRRHGVQLTFNHQRRMLNAFQNARTLIHNGAIGELKRLEGACDNFLDWGTHWINMFLFFNAETPAEWVMAQADVRGDKIVYGVRHETDGMVWMRFANGVDGLLFTGSDGEKAVGCSIRAVGSEGWLEVSNTAPHVRWQGKGDAAPRALEGEDTRGGLHDFYAIERGIADLVAALETGADPTLSVTNALPTTEIIYAAYESVRRRGRVDLPLTIDDHPLQALWDSGAFAGHAAPAP